jgi:hypothetical protein
MDSEDVPDLAAILPRFKQWHIAHGDELAAAGLTTRLRESPPEWPKASISLELDAGRRLSQLIVWDSGETELDLADLDTGVHIPQHRIIHTPNDLDDLLSQQLTWHQYRPPPT